MSLSDEIKNKIKNHALEDLDKEVCGLIIKDNVIPCVNLSPNPEVHFVINPILLIGNNVDFIYHSHVKGTSEPSKTDIMFQKQIRIPFVIYSIEEDDFYFLNN